MAPMWIYESEDYVSGDNRFTIEEEILCGAYETRGRPDLAHCVKAGRRYQRLQQIIYYANLANSPEETILGALNGLTDAMTEGQEPRAISLLVWQQRATVRHAADPYLAEVVALDASLKGIRKPAKPAGPLSTAPRTDRLIPVMLATL